MLCSEVVIWEKRSLYTHCVWIPVWSRQTARSHTDVLTPQGKAQTYSAPAVCVFAGSATPPKHGFLTNPCLSEAVRVPVFLFLRCSVSHCRSRKSAEAFSYCCCRGRGAGDSVFCRGCGGVRRGAVGILSASLSVW